MVVTFVEGGIRMKKKTERGDLQVHVYIQWYKNVPFERSLYSECFPLYIYPALHSFEFIDKAGREAKEPG